jgi:hypothetical protein
MARYQAYKCPECEGVFRHFHHPDDSPPPDRCVLCGAWVSEGAPPEPVFVPQAPGIRKSDYVKSVDQVYRTYEDASIQRAEDAADHLDQQLRDNGVDEETRRKEIFELKSGLKVTNVRDPSEMREGDMATIMPPTGAEAQLTTSINQPGFKSLNGPVPNYAPGVGPKNADVISSITKDHTPRAIQMIQAGRMNK